MKTIIETKTAGTIEIDSTFKGDKKANWSGGQENWNNHKVTVKYKGKKFAFDFWSSMASPKMKEDSDNINAFYCSLSDAISAKESFSDFCSNFGYDEDSRTAERIYKACEKTLVKVEKVFECDLYDLVNEIQETFDC